WEDLAVVAGPPRSVAAGAVGSAEGLAGVHAAARHEAAAYRSPVVAAGLVVDARRAAELAPRHYRHVVEHAALIQVLDQGAEALVELAAVVAHEAEVLAVAVPAAEGQRHAAHARFHEAAGDEQLIVHRRRAVE